VSECKKIYNSPPMKEFFNRESWKNPNDEVFTQAVGSRLTEYQDAFCQGGGKTKDNPSPSPGGIQININPFNNPGSWRVDQGGNPLGSPPLPPSVNNSQGAVGQ
jgi:hypothetical protein